MVVSLKHKFNCAKSDGTDATAVKPSDWNNEHDLLAVAGKVLGTPVGSTAVTELPLEVDSTLQSVKLPAGATGSRPATPGAGMFRYNSTTSRLEYYTNSAWKNVDNMTVSASQPATAIAGDLWIDTASSNALKLYTGSVWVAVVADGAITYSKIQNVSATSRILGRKSAGAGSTEEMTLSELLDFVGSAAQGDILYRGASGWVRLPAGTANQVLRTGGAGANPSWSSIETFATPQSLTGSTITFSSIPTGVRQIEVVLSGISITGTAGFRLRLGTSSGLATTGYNSTTHCINADTGGGGNILREYDTGGFICLLWNGADYVGNGRFTLTNVTGNTWVVTHTLGVYLPSDINNSMLSSGGGTVTLGGTLDRVALLPVSGTFDSGTANILYTVT